MQINNSKDNLTKIIKNMITKIINHKHTKTLAALLVVAGLVGYASNYKKSEAFDYSTYMYNVNIQSNNNDKRIAVAGNKVSLSFEVFDANVLSNLTASINRQPVAVTCELISNQNLNFNFIESAYAQSYNPASCTALLDITQTDIDAAPFLISTLPFEIKFTQQVPDPLNGEEFIPANFIATNTDDGSLVNITRNGKASDFTSNVNIKSTTPNDTTLASPDNKVVVSYYINNYEQVSNHTAIILDKKADILCQPAKEGIPSQAASTSPILSDTATEAQSGIKFPSVIITDPLAPSNPIPDPVSVPATNSPFEAVSQVKSDNIPTQTEAQSELIPTQVKSQFAPALEKVQQIIDNSPATFLESVVVKAYAKEDITKGGTGTSFSGPAFCQASIDTSAEDLQNTEYNIVPFVISATFTSRINKTDIKIENTTDSSFVRIVKASPVTETQAQPAGILAIGLTSPTPTTVIPQNTLVKDNNVNTIDTKPNQNNTCTPIKGFYKIGDVNPEIKRIKENINKSMGTKLTLNNKFDKEMFVALKAWQEKYRDTVLDPWEMTESSGYFYKTSNWSMNYQAGCAVPKFVLEKYRNN